MLVEESIISPVLIVSFWLRFLLLFDFSFVTCEQFWQFVGDGHVQLVDGAALEKRAGRLQRREIVQGVQPEKDLVRVRIGQVVSENRIIDVHETNYFLMKFGEPYLEMLVMVEMPS